MTRAIRLAAASLIALTATAWVAAPRAQPAAPSAAAEMSSTESLRQAVRADRRGVVERNMQLTATEAKKFWPLYDDYQAKLNPIQRRQTRALQDYIAAESSLTDANANRIARELLQADADEQRARETVAKKLLAVLPARKAARYLQIENKIRTMQRFDIAEQMSLVR